MLTVGELSSLAAGAFGDHSCFSATDGSNGAELAVGAEWGARATDIHPTARNSESLPNSGDPRTDVAFVLIGARDGLCNLLGGIAIFRAGWKRLSQPWRTDCWGISSPPSGAFGRISASPRLMAVMGATWRLAKNGRCDPRAPRI